MVEPCVNPIRNPPCVITFESAVGIGKPPVEAAASGVAAPGCESADVAAMGMSKSPFTSCRSGASWRSHWYTEGEVRLPRQRIWPILPGDRSFLNCSQAIYLVCKIHSCGIACW